MLSSLSWQQYFLAITILTTSYYLYIGLRYYPYEIRNLFINQSKASDLFSTIQLDPFQAMGKAKPDDVTRSCETNELQFAETVPDESDQNADLLQTESAYLERESSLQELFNEAGTLADAFKENSNKGEFLMLLKILIDSYQPYHDNTERETVFAEIIEQTKSKLQFTVSLTDF